ncbi:MULTISPECIES: SDR family NAD(P)-dependent oxidoreductase [unclassified Rhizobacter]|uniref:SDR family NAD(P)-dependent oxidoreductase n=1 Tax=unclassified Rhizobacter TaxID=2640088 RepID=UPI0006F743EE|nr:MULTISPECIES: SDR family NAD(P)-dependent oxidoreductase [unclassified Rhizobacter]KQU66105.1 oxidoreductase [Rhizobacter sp. Root29]KQV97757.1 oxidoreductase [Rhizobacter sp. Root1238]KRB18859.1 oxidoreductase [Rhizobacter sp. Root16D2]
MKKIIVITGASSGFGALSARALADAGHTVYAGMRAIATRNAKAAQDAARYATERRVDLRSIELDVGSQASVDAAVARIVDTHQRLDVIVHNAGHLVTGPAEAFTPEQIAQVFDVNTLGTQRLNRAALPQLRRQRHGLVVWVSSSSVKGGTPPFLGPYFAAKAAMDALAVSYAGELARFGVETSIVVPGAFTSGTNHFAHATHAADADVAQAYDALYAGLPEQVGEALAKLEPADADVADVARAIVAAVDAPYGQRPYRLHVDPSDDGSGIVSAVADRMRVQLFERAGLSDLLKVVPTVA